MSRILSFALITALIVTSTVYAATFDISTALASSGLKSAGTSGFEKTTSSGSASSDKGKYIILVIAVNKEYRISPSISYAGSVGGEGCDFVSKLLGSPGCETTSIRGSGTLIRTKDQPGRHARFLVFIVPMGTTSIIVAVPSIAECGKENGKNCAVKATSFFMQGYLADAAKPGCSKLLRVKRKTWRHCGRKWFLGKKRCSTRCDWRPCPQIEIVVRAYASRDKFTLVEFTGTGVDKCTSSKAEFFTL